ncbi:hypothetical protein NPIL_655691 [Nephila pilipes]|uniref:Uncharacterized protein n=1 Tax=Nephila pilipes TaxID=299642 RepID=A0A8X6M676_NEPPI|nr:hypothetical protein NPIL_655691 [Nephila pilipes]
MSTEDGERSGRPKEAGNSKNGVTRNNLNTLSPLSKKIVLTKNHKKVKECKLSAVENERSGHLWEAIEEQVKNHDHVFADKEEGTDFDDDNHVSNI